MCAIMYGLLKNIVISGYSEDDDIIGIAVNQTVSDVWTNVIRSASDGAPGQA